MRASLRSELGEALRADGRLAEARKSCETALKIFQELKDVRSQAVELARLGALGLADGKLDDGRSRLEEARRLFQAIGEAEMEAAAWHQLGKIYHAEHRWGEAERHYREAARINIERHRLSAAAQTWTQLAVLARDAGNPQSAEAWYRTAIEVERKAGNHAELGHHLMDLAGLLRNEPGRMTDARQLAEEALGIAQRLDPTGADCWARYGSIAAITELEARATPEGERKSALEAQARQYRELERYGPIIAATLAALGQPI